MDARANIFNVSPRLMGGLWFMPPWYSLSAPVAMYADAEYLYLNAVIDINTIQIAVTFENKRLND